jgi:hypothetical protein
MGHLRRATPRREKQLNNILIYAERNMMIKARTKSELIERAPIGTFREGKVMRQLSVNTGFDMPVSLSDSIISRRPSEVAECDIKIIVKDPSKVFRAGIIPRFFARESHIGYQHISSQFLARDFSGVPVGLFGCFSGLSCCFDASLVGTQRSTGKLSMTTDGDPLEKREDRVGSGDNQHYPIRDSWHRLAGGFLVLVGLLVGYHGAWLLEIKHRRPFGAILLAAASLLIFFGQAFVFFGNWNHPALYGIP